MFQKIYKNFTFLMYRQDFLRFTLTLNVLTLEDNTFLNCINIGAGWYIWSKTISPIQTFLQKSILEASKKWLILFRKQTCLLNAHLLCHSLNEPKSLVKNRCSELIASDGETCFGLESRNQNQPDNLNL